MSLHPPTYPASRRAILDNPDWDIRYPSVPMTADFLPLSCSATTKSSTSARGHQIDETKAQRSMSPLIGRHNASPGKPLRFLPPRGLGPQTLPSMTNPVARPCIPMRRRKISTASTEPTAVDNCEPSLAACTPPLHAGGLDRRAKKVENFVTHRPLSAPGTPS